ncbi:MAG TPA: prenyltransferase/squalene oxidase repeat-containing protein [Planctomycetota bacterium]|nr:prenyltransferase/squalene oxidase repeat-containing protein [Planctomycetota bacterium]
MTELRRSLKLFFAREAERLGSLARIVRRLGGRRPRLPGPSRTRRLARGGGTLPAAEPTLAASDPGGDPAAWGQAASWTLSVVLHIAFVLALLLFHFPRPPGVPDGGAHAITLWRLPGPPATRDVPGGARPEAASPEPSADPPRTTGREQVETGTEEEIAGAPAPGEAIPALETPRGPPDPAAAPGAAIARLPRFGPPPIGVGSSPRALQGGGAKGTGSFSRRGLGKRQALERRGGSTVTENAVTRGLAWLAEHQDQDGGWSADGFQRHCRHVTACPGKGQDEFDVGITALAVLAFLGAGIIPETPHGVEPLHRAAREQESSPYRRNVRKAIDYLLDHQDGSGAFGATGDNYFYNHTLSLFAMSEACAVTRSPRHRSSCEAGVAFSISAQQPGGGWDYTARPGNRNDLSITGWQIMALRSAASAGIAVPDHVLERTRHFLSRAVTADGQGIYAQVGQEAGRRGINMTAVGLLSKLYAGALPTEAPVRRAVERLLREPPDWHATGAWDDTFQSYYYWYTATLALFHLGGEEWWAWNFLLLRTLLPLQSRKPHEEGSWPPEPSWIGLSGGRVYSTAINVLTLETYYRYEPLFESKRS